MATVHLPLDDLKRLSRARGRLRTGAATIPRIAKDAGFSSFYFIRRFHAAFGVTPHQYRIRSRLEQAKRLLALDEHSVTDICVSLGYSSLGSFSALFTRRVGQSPSAYRRRLRPLVQVPRSLPSALTPGCLSLMARLPADAFRTFREARSDDTSNTRCPETRT